jgi:hypothetical protein
MIDLTIVVVSHETRALLAACLASVARAAERASALRIETIVVDNGSRDGSVDVARAASVRPRLVALARNRGFATAVNRALPLRRGRHVLLLNSDAEIDGALLEGGVALLDESPALGALGVSLFHVDARPQRVVHPLPDWATELLPEPLLRRLRPNGFDPSSGAHAGDASGAVVDVEAVRGAVLFLRGDVFEKVGLLDEGYFFFLEETDYCARLHEAGYRVAFAPSLRAIHHLGASSKRRVPLETRIEFHRSLYRHLERRHGRVVAAAARALRTVRNAVTCLALLPVAIVSHAARSRLAERGGLLLWHLRGCPPAPDLASALARLG